MEMLALLLIAAVAKPPSVAVLPIVSEKGSEALAYAITLRMSEAVEAVATQTQFHAKTVQLTIDNAHIAEATLADLGTAREMARRLGASHVITGVMKAKTLTLQLVNANGDVEATAKGAANLLPPVADLMAVPPLSPVSEKAYMEYATCHRRLTRQPVSLRAPAVLDADNRAAAVASCQNAVQLDPGLVQAWAALGFARAMVNEKEQAEAALAKAKDARHPYYTIGKFWLLSRFYDSSVAVQFLKDSIAKAPGYLIVRGYLGEAYHTLNKNEDALDAFQAYLKDVPDSPWAHTQVGHSLARLKRFNEALDMSIKAVNLAPDDEEARLELASRFVDAGKLDDARKMLETLSKAPDARGEVFLRLGYVHFAQGKLDDAEKHVTVALQRAKQAREWRTRGRGRYDLAKIALRRGDKERALTELEAALNEGYRDNAKLLVDKDFDALRPHPRFLALTSRTKPQQIVVPTFATPFAHDAFSGEHAPVVTANPRGTKTTGMTGVAF